jgi:hypothetical protein
MMRFRNTALYLVSSVLPCTFLHIYQFKPPGEGDLPNLLNQMRDLLYISKLKFPFSGASIGLLRFEYMNHKKRISSVNFRQ